jgi:glycerol uptake operon antiterminator
MPFNQQFIVPAIRDLKNLDKFLQSPYQYGVILEIHIAQLKHVMELIKKHNKKVLIHADLIHGLKNDEYSTEYLCQEIKPFGIISTRMNVIQKAKQRGIMGILRVFLIDSYALEKSLAILSKGCPDYIEVLPGTLTGTIREVAQNVKVPILAGGFIRTIEDVKQTLEAGAIAVTTSNVDLWKNYITNEKSI